MLSQDTSVPLIQPGESAGGEGEQECQSHEQPGLECVDEGDHRQGHHRRKREVDLPGDDDEGEPQRHDEEQWGGGGEGLVDVGAEEDRRGRQDEGQPDDDPDREDADLQS